MSYHVGNTEQPPDQSPPSSARAEQTFCTLGFTVLAVACVLCLFEQTGNVQMPRGIYAILAAGIVIGGVGWTVVWSVGRAEARVAAGIEADHREVVDRLAQLTSTVQDTPARTKPAASCRAPAIYTSRASQGETVGIRAGTVEAPTDPSGRALQRAREDGIEEGFDIGLKVQLADRGVTPLPRPRRPRLTGDS